MSLYSNKVNIFSEKSLGSGSISYSTKIIGLAIMI